MINLRPSFLSDAPALAQLGRDSFTAAFQHLYTPDDLASFLDETHDVDTVRAEIASDDFVHQLACEGETLAGYCKLARKSSFFEHSEARHPITLSQLYAAPGRTGEGIGHRLMEWAIAAARDKGHDAMLLSVWSENRQAHRFYARYGFAKIADIHFKVGEHLDEEYLFELPLGRGE